MDAVEFQGLLDAKSDSTSNQSSCPVRAENMPQNIPFGQHRIVMLDPEANINRLENNLGPVRVQSWTWGSILVKIIWAGGAGTCIICGIALEIPAVLYGGSIAAIFFLIKEMINLYWSHAKNITNFKQKGIK